ncbi:NAD-dependent epimerase/dehydratase family protein [Cereibacter changlensis]|nr:NAD-dependent epimerase/dehydratase family protein [Cereibacter changlensis]PZX59028.1 NAD-dependent epimerase/dehydratase family protein [Cereibacter changlensis]
MQLLVLGANGRIGRELRRIWPRDLPGGLRPLWHSRNAGFRWDMLAEPFPGMEPGGVVLNLAGVTDARRPVTQNIDLAMAACAAAEAAGARHLFLLSSAAVYGAHPTYDFREIDPPAPANPYGRAKLEMEQAAQDWASPGKPGLTILRLGNVVGADALLGRARPGAPVLLDPAPGQEGGPLRSYIGPRSLASVLARLAALAAEDAPLPQLLNLAAAPPVSMRALLEAAGLDWRWGPETPDVIPRVGLDTRLLQGLCPLPPGAGDPAAMVAEWRTP